MKRLLFSLLLVSIAFQGFAQDLKEVTLTNQIKEVTLFLSGAQVFETATGTLPAGESVLLVKGLSPYLDEKSIQVKGQGNFIIQAVNKRLDFLHKKESGEKAEALEIAIEEIEKRQSILRNRLQVLATKMSVLTANKSIGSSQAGTSMIALKATLDFFDAEHTKIINEELQINTQMEANKAEIVGLRNQRYALKQSDNRSTSEIRIRIKAPNAGQASFQLNYLVANAGWYPKYDLRVKSITEPLQLQYKAEIYQNTGRDWKNVKLRLSNANPNQSGQAPSLEQWQLNFVGLAVPRNFNLPQLPRSISGQVLDHKNTPLAGVSVLVKGSTLGTVTDLEGKYSLVLPKNESTLVFSFVGKQIEERQVSNESILNVTLFDEGTVILNEAADPVFYKKSLNQLPFAAENAQEELLTQLVFNPTTVEIEVTDPYSIKSNGERTLVDLKTYEIPASYRYTAIPKLEKDAFLQAEISDWSQYSLLEGESNLYFEDGFVGRSILNPNALQDTLQISMGRDRSILIQREKVDQLSKKRSIGSNITESRGYEILVKNNKSQEITLQVKDQIPVSINSAITVTTGELSGGVVDPVTGIVTWEITLAPGAQQKLTLRYEVKYPKSERLILD
jgi:predicted HTH domain antitoxin